MKAAQISRPGGEFDIVERKIPKPAAGQVLITSSDAEFRVVLTM
jgi:NADPH:quinone reductase-like Zn-dependent oxidoreductase